MKISYKINILVAMSAMTLMLLSIVNTGLKEKNDLVQEQNRAVSQIGMTIQDTLIYQLEFQDDFLKEYSVYQSIAGTKKQLKLISKNLLVGIKEINSVSNNLVTVEVKFKEYADNLKALQQSKFNLNLQLKRYIVLAKALNTQIDEENSALSMMGEQPNPAMSSLASISRGILISLNEYLVALNQELLLEDDLELFQQHFDDIQNRLIIEKKDYLGFVQILEEQKYKDMGTDLIKLLKLIQEETPIIRDFHQNSRLNISSLAKLEEKIQKSIQIAGEKNYQYSLQVSKQFDQISQTLSIITVFLMLIIGWFIGKSITTPINTVLEFINELRTGRLDQRLRVKSHDEMKMIAKSINEFVDTLQEKANIADRVAAGDLEVNTKLVSEGDTLGNSIQLMLKSLQDKTRAMERVAAGDLSEVPELASEKDALGKAIQVMIEGLQDKTQLAKSVASGDLTAEVTLSSEEDELGHALQEMLHGLKEKARLALNVAEGDLTGNIIPSSSHDQLSHALLRMVESLQQKVRVAEQVACGDLTAVIELASEKDELGKALQAMLSSLTEKAEFVEKVATGDLETEIKPSSPQDVLARSFQKMLQGLTAKVSSVQSLASGDFTTTIKLSSDRDRLGRAIQQINQDLSAVLSQVSTNSSSITELVVQTNERTSIVMNSSKEMSTNIAILASTAQEINTTIQAISNNSHKIAANMDNISEATEGGLKNTNEISIKAETASTISNDAQQKSQVAEEAMAKLSQSAYHIGDVTKLIKEISQQTNLLALNANIEAASAGEAGKGFSVVANEIKELANQSAQASGSITNNIKEMQGNTSYAVSTIQDMSKIITEINASSIEICQLTEKQQNMALEVSMGIKESSSGASEISRLLEEMSTGSKEMAQRSTNLAQGSQEISENIDCVYHEIKTYESLALELSGLMKNFRLN